MQNFKLVEATNLTLTDRFLVETSDIPEDVAPYVEWIKELIMEGVSNFYAPIYDPSRSDSDKRVCYVPGSDPAVEMPYEWWCSVAENFDKKHGSRLGTESEWMLFLATRIKWMTENGWSVKDAWMAVCFNSEPIAHCWNSKDAIHKIETTGSRELGGFFDLGNTLKMFNTDEKETDHFCLAGSCYRFGGECSSLVKITKVSRKAYLKRYHVGWIIIPAA